MSNVAPPKSPMICDHQLTSKIGFRIAINPDAVTGVRGMPVDDITRAYHDNAANPNLLLLKLMLQFLKPDGVVLDLGAHIGTFSLTAAARGCRAYAVEASPRNVELLRESAGQNGWADRLHVVHAAIGDRKGELSFHVAGPWGHVGTVWRPGSATVAAETVDDLMTQFGCNRVDFVKLDVEGSEVAALAGARRLLGRPDAPPIRYKSNAETLEFFGQTPASLRNAFIELGYAHHYLIFRSRRHLFLSDRLVALAPDDVQVSVCSDFLATKTPLTDVPGWKIERMSRRTMVKWIVAVGHQANLDHTALRNPRADLLRHRQVVKLLRSLKGDPSGAVRASVERYAGAPPGVLERLAGRLTRLLGYPAHRLTGLFDHLARRLLIRASD